MKSKKIWLYVKTHNEYFGIVAGLLILGLFSTVMLPIQYAGLNSYWLGTLIRIPFTIGVYFVYTKLFNRKFKDVFHFKHYRKALLASAPYLGLIIFRLVQLCFYKISTENHFFDIVILIVFQLLIGVWEELEFRGLFLEGFIQKHYNSLSYRLLACLLSGLVFGAVHMIDATSIPSAIYRLIFTGIAGLAFASIYLYSKNLFIPMLLHGVYDVFTSVVRYLTPALTYQQIQIFNIINYVFLGAMFIIALLFIILPVIKRNNNKKQPLIAANKSSELSNG